MSEHIDIERLLAYAHDAPEGAEADAILEHSWACKECGDQLAVMLALRSEGAGSGVSEPRARFIGLIAASVLLAVLLGVALTWGGFGSGFIYGSAVETSLAELATTEAPGRIDLDFLFDTSLPTSTDDSRLQKRAGFELIVNGRHDEAIELLSALRNARSDDGDVTASLGIALYLSGDSSDKVEALLVEGDAAWLQGLQHYAKWYLGNHYLRQGDLVQAMGALEEIAREPDSPGRRAAELLRRLQSETR